MKGIGFRTILLALIIILLVVSVSLIGFTVFRMTKAAANDKTEDFWKANKMFLLTPTVMNVMAMALLAVLIISG